MLQPILGLGFLFGVAVSRSTAQHQIASPTATPTSIIADTFTAWATANVAPTAAPIAIKAAIAVGVGITDAEVTIGNATITTTGDATIRSSTNHAVNVLADEDDPKAGAVAVSVVVYNAVADVQPQAVLTVGGNLFVQADTTYARRNLARTVSGGDGSIGVAVAVDYANGSTDAYLDGTAHVAGNVNVTAKETTNPLTGNKAFVVPVLPARRLRRSRAWGPTPPATSSTTCGRSIITSGKGAISNFVSTTTKQPIKWLREKFQEKFPPEQPPPVAPAPMKPDIQFAGAVAIVLDTNKATARIGDGSTTDLATVEAGGSISVTSTVNSFPFLGAGSSVDSSGNKTTFEGQTATGDTRYGASLAATVGLYENDADAHIAGNAIVDAGSRADGRGRHAQPVQPLRHVPHQPGLSVRRRQHDRVLHVRQGHRDPHRRGHGAGRERYTTAAATRDRPTSTSGPTAPPSTWGRKTTPIRSSGNPSASAIMPSWASSGS